MSDNQNVEAILAIEEARAERIEMLTARELNYAIFASIITLTVMLFGAGSPELLRLWLSALAGGFFLAAGFTRFQRNLAIIGR